MKSVNYIIADDHRIFRQGLKMVLSSDRSLTCIGEADNGADLIRLLEKSNADLVLLDLKMPVMDGMEAAKVIRERFPEVKIIVLTMHDDEQFVLHLIEAGANGYLIKNAEPEEIINAIHTVQENKYYFNDLVNRAMLRRIVRDKIIIPEFKPDVILNEKEISVLQLVCEGLTAAEIAEKIFLSPRTVEGIRSGIMDKAGVRNIAGLVMFAVRSGYAK